ncbi:MAG: DUF429 domain-containing protein [Magnetococcales bacterium]|nr:DUF429 domain-containing protein [Magnetococcales bacterium]NGZ06107.1 DUF429 domain-containing protein [Magnetococcales bacterium]
MKVYGIDPAPKKDLIAYDGEKFEKRSIHEVRSFIEGLSKEPDLFVCWDAPLTGPSLLAIMNNKPGKSEFSQRALESFFMQHKNILPNYTGKLPPGVSILPYSGCPHWVISRSLLGLPKCGPFDQMNQLPFQLTDDNSKSPPTEGRYIAEVHPALALWLWCKDKNIRSWRYKGLHKGENTLENREALENILIDHLINSCGIDYSPMQPITDDDCFDAWIAFILGDLWINKKQTCVGMLGNNNTGKMLLPNIEGLQKSFSDFVQKKIKKGKWIYSYP